MDGQFPDNHLGASRPPTACDETCLGLARAAATDLQSGPELEQAGSDQTRLMAEAQRRALIGCWSLSWDQRTAAWSEEFYALIGRTRQAYPPSFERMLALFHPEDHHLLEGLGARLTAERDSGRTEARLIGPDGKPRHVAIEYWLSATRSAEAEVHGYMQDISRRKEAELALVRSEKLAILGHLTGSIAHDFNNLLTVMSLNLEEAITELPPQHDLQDVLLPALQAAQRGADLTNQLLSYARQAPVRPQAITIQNFLTTCRPLLQRAVGARHRLNISVADGLCKPTVDRAQLETALLNLVINARDASPEESVVSVDIESIVLPSERFSLPELKPGHYAMLSVCDTGCGIPHDVLPNVFTPFFTTKTGDASSGLGLSMVDGFVRQSGGGVIIETMLSHGTSVRMFLPLEDVQAGTPMRGASEKSRPKALLVDDEPAVLAIVTRMFSQLGYDVHAVADATAALHEIEANPGFDILFSDVVLGGEMNGIDLCRIVRHTVPGIKILLTSGFNDYTEAVAAAGDIALLQKPYKRQELYDRLAVLMAVPSCDAEPDTALPIISVGNTG